MTKARAARRTKGGQPPISSHPAFPAIVALWFAALFGIGTLVLPNILIEKAVDAVGLAAVIPAAAPPIGFTAKLTLAIGAAIVGILAGLFVARKIVASQSAVEPSRAAEHSAREEIEAPVKRPIVATEELGEEGLGRADDDDLDEPIASAGKPPLPGRRRALSVTDDSGRSDYLSHVPVPGESDAPPADQPAVAFAAADPANRRDRSNVIPDGEESDGREAGPADPLVSSADRPFDAPLAFPAQPATGGDGDDYQAAATPGASEPLDPDAPHAPDPASEVASPEAASLAELSMSELIARFARSMQSAEAATAAAASAAEPQAAGDDPFEEAASAVPFAFDRPARPTEAVERADEVAAALPPFAPPAVEQADAVPAALRPLDLGAFEEEDAEDDPFDAVPGFSFGAPDRMFDRPLEAAAAPVAFTAPGAPAAFIDPLAGADEDEDPGDDDSYSSLLSIKSPLGSHRDFPRVEEEESGPVVTPEPVVVFPGQAQPLGAAPEAPRPFDAPAFATGADGLARAVPAMPAQRPVDPAETERALREALEKLQRMSGAA